MRKTGGLHGLVVAADLALQRGNDALQRLAAQAAISLGQGAVGKGFGARFIHARMLL